MLTTEQIMDVALNLSGFGTTPADSAIYVSGKEIGKLMFGIDAGAPELLLAKQLGYDAVISHHPKGGSAVVNFHEVFMRHIQQMIEAGISRGEAERAVRQKMAALNVEMQARNYGHAVDVARILNMPFLNIHTPLDELGRRRMSDVVKMVMTRTPKVGDIVSALSQLPEFQHAETEIQVCLGRTSNPAGKTVVSHGAGTNGGYEIAKTYFKHGIGTVIYIHISAADLRRLETDCVGNMIVTGHIAGDSVGINPFINELESQGISVTRIGIVPP